ncbi:hypothetical protein ACU686_40710 [Yinghuangia aomiensis]
MRRPERPVFRDPETGFERHIVSAAPGAGGAELVAHYLPAQVSTGLLPAYPPGNREATRGARSAPSPSRSAASAKP